MLDLLCALAFNPLTLSIIIIFALHGISKEELNDERNREGSETDDRADTQGLSEAGR